MLNEILKHSNTEICNLIQSIFTKANEISIVHSRIIDGLTYDEIIKKYYLEDFSENEKRLIVRKKIDPLIKKLYKALQNSENAKTLII